MPVCPRNNYVIRLGKKKFELFPIGNDHFLRTRCLNYRNNHFGIFVIFRNVFLIFLTVNSNVRSLVRVLEIAVRLLISLLVFWFENTILRIVIRPQ